MNKEFVKKMIKAERLRYEAVKELMPDKLREKTEDFEKEAFSFIKDISLELLKENIKSEEESKDKTKTDKKSTKKVDVDFC